MDGRSLRYIYIFVQGIGNLLYYKLKHSELRNLVKSLCSWSILQLRFSFCFPFYIFSPSVLFHAIRFNGNLDHNFCECVWVTILNILPTWPYIRSFLRSTIAIGQPNFWYSKIFQNVCLLNTDHQLKSWDFQL